MSRFPRLARTLQAIVLASLPLSAAGCCEEETIVNKVIIDSDAPRFRDLVDRCRADEFDCWALCTKAYEEIYGQGTSQYANYGCDVTFDPAGQTVVEVREYVGYCEDDGVVEGRRPPGLVEAICSSATPAGLWLAKMARLEEASVYAFMFLATELEHHGAPAELVDRAWQSAIDEIGHARAMAALAERYQATPPRAVVDLPDAPRSLEVIAIENVTEGCVRETFGALVALHQSHAASDPVVRQAMSGIAADELRHAELSWDIDQWIRSTVPSLGEKLDVARTRALHELSSELENGPADDVCAQLGLPSKSASDMMMHNARSRRVWG